MKAVEELKAALAAATPGEWEPHNTDIETPDIIADQGKGWNNPTVCNFYDDVTPDDSVTIGQWYEPCHNAKANAHLIALMHNALPALIECAEALKDCHARLELLTESGRGKMLDAVAKQRAEAALAKLENPPCATS